MTTHPLVLRRDAAQSVIDAFRGQAFAWGKADCVRLAAAVLRALGHNPRLAKAGAYSTEGGARAALARTGFAGLAEAIDALGLERIAPAAALPGDIIALASDSDGWPALTVAIGNGRVLGFHGDPPVCHVLHPHLDQVGAGVAAWRVDPKVRKTPKALKQRATASDSAQGIS